MMIYVCLFVWVIYSIIEGKREAFFWHHRMKSSDYEFFKDIDRHPLFAIQRGLMLVSISISTYYILDSFLLSLYIFLMNCLIFSFFHNGSMYLERYKMSIIVNQNDSTKWLYKKGWWDQSTTSTAWSTKIMTPISRTIQAIIGLIGYILIPLLSTL
jgi:hypothetical protein